MALEFIKPTYSPVKSVNGQTGDVVIEIPSHEGLATEAYVNEAISHIDIPEVDLTGYATEEYVNRKVAEAAIGGEVNLDDYATKTYVDDAIAAIDASGVSEDRVNELIDERGYQTGEDVMRTIGTEVDIAIRERNLVNEDRAREIANEVCDERGTGGGSEVVCWEGTLDRAENPITLSEDEKVQLLEVGNRDALISISNDDDGTGYTFTSYAHYDDYGAQIEFQGVEEATGGLLSSLFFYTDNNLLEFMLNNDCGTAYIRISLVSDRDYYTKEEVDDKIAGIGDSGVSEDRVNELISEALAAIGVAEEGAY